MSRTFKTPKGTELPLQDIKGKPYLGVQHRILWFREEHPDWTIESEPLVATNDETRFKAIIKNENGRILADGFKREDKKGFPDHYEKAQTGAIGRALGILGYGTAFALELEEGERLADAPVESKKKEGPKESISAGTNIPQNAHRDPLEANDDSYHYLIGAGSLEGKLIGEVEQSVLYQKSKEAHKWLLTALTTHPMYNSIYDFVKHAENYLEQSGFDEEEVVPEVIEAKGPKASASLVGKVIKGYQLKGIDAHKLNEMLGTEFNEGFPTLTEATAKTMLDRIKE